MSVTLLLRTAVSSLLNRLVTRLAAPILPKQARLDPRSTGISSPHLTLSGVVNVSKMRSWAAWYPSWSGRSATPSEDDVANDIKGWTTGTNDTSGQLRSERYGKDLAGNTKSCQATLTLQLTTWSSPESPVG